MASLLCALLAMASVALSNASMKSGVIVTAPNTWLLNREEKICVSFHGIDFDVATATTLTKDQQVFSRKVNFNQGTDGCFTMMVEGSEADISSGDMSLRFVAEGTGGATYSFDETTEVFLVNNRDLKVNVTFIETDKPLYKPGDEVKFRVLTIQEELKPRLENIPLVYITSPQQVRIMQWRDVDVQATQGIGEFSMELSSDPVYGEWKIHVQMSGYTEVRTFEVKEYVLPKFEVVISPVTYLSIGAEAVESEVCAHYTYGEPVKGNLTVNMCMTAPPAYLSSASDFQCQNIDVQINGCHKFDIRVQDLIGSSRLTRASKHLYYYAHVDMNAMVMEEGTGVVMNATYETPKLGFDLYKLEMVDMAQYFKPGLPYHGKVSVTDVKTGSPAQGVTVTVTAKHPDTPQELSLVTDSNGVAMWTWTNLELPDNEQNLMISAIVTADIPTSDPYHDLYQMPDEMTSVKAWYSPSDSFLVIDSVSEEIECGGRLAAHVAYNQGHSHHFYYKITTQYSIVMEGELEHTHGANGITVDVQLPDDVWGKSSLVVYYVRRDGEIVADSKTFNVKHCIKNKVEMSFSSPEVAPGDDVSVELKASPGSICGYGVMDKSIKLLATGDRVEMSSLLWRIPTKVPSRGYNHWGYTDEYCQEQIRIQEEEEQEQKEEDEKKKSREERREERRRNRGRGRKNRQQRDIMPRPYPGRYRAYSRYVDSSEAFKDISVKVLSDLILDTRPCESRPDYPYVYEGMPVPVFDLAFDPPQAMPLPGAPGLDREESPAVPAAPAPMAPVNTPVVDSVRSFFPETWLWSLATVGPSGVASLPQTAPDTITEWVGRATCSHVEDGLGISMETSLKTFQPFFLSFTLPYSVVRGETVHMPVSVFNYLSECLVIQMELESSTKYRLASGSATTEVCVCGQEKATQTFPITALELGHINITVTAVSIDKAGVCGNMIMSTQIGVRDTVIRELLIEPEGKEEEFADSDFVCPSGSKETRTMSLTLPTDVVADSAKAYVSVMGDVMGPALSGLEDLIALPTGCGEQTMLRFSPNIYILQYLTNTNQLTDAIESKTLGYLRSGYQRELTYRHPDGSYSAFGSSDDSGSTWLSAFVLKSFSQAKQYIDIDEDDLMKTQEWFNSNQMENGCYRHVGRIIHKSMKGGLSSNTDNSPGLTAYVLGAMLESGQNKDSFMVSGAVDCLRIQTINDTYTIALTAYALSKWDPEHAITSEFMDRLDALANTYDGTMSWASGTESSAEVETTAYALMAKLQMSSSIIMEVLPIVRWLTMARNHGGGFHSTQDTVVGLQALAMFAERVYGEQGNVRVKVTQSASNRRMNFVLNNDNKLLLQRQEVTVPNEITFETSGRGCAFVQSTMKYHIQDISSGSKPSITLHVTPSRSEDENCRHRILKTCFRYEGPDDTTNMAMMVAKMVSGWTPDKDSVEQLKQDTTLNIKRVETEKNKVIIYFNELLRGQLMCVEFKVVEEIVVTSARPGSVSVFDYYDDDNVYAETDYSLRTICGTKEEIPLNAVDQGNFENVDEIVQLRQPVELPGPLGSQPEPEPVACPQCHTQNVDANLLKDVFCSASHVYGSVVRRNGRVKFNKDLTKTGSAARVRKTVVVTMDESCSCDVLNDRGQFVWVITADSTLESTGRNKGALLLTEKDTVIPVDQRPRSLNKLLKKTRRSPRCQN